MLLFRSDSKQNKLTLSLKIKVHDDAYNMDLLYSNSIMVYEIFRIFNRTSLYFQYHFEEICYKVQKKLGHGWRKISSERIFIRWTKL